MDSRTRADGQEGHRPKKQVLRTLEAQELKRALQAHAEWVASKTQRGARVDLSFCTLQLADFKGAELSAAVFRGSNLTGAIFEDAQLVGADLRHANLTNVSLKNCNASHARMAWATLQAADVTGAVMLGADLSHVDLRDATLAGARFGETRLAATSLLRCRGLEQLTHGGPSPVDFRTLERSGALPAAFLLGCGVPSVVVAALPSLLGSRLDFPSYFVVYGPEDSDAARTLCERLREFGARAWARRGNRDIGLLSRDLDPLGNSVVLVLLSEATREQDWLEPLASWGRRTAKVRGEHRMLFFVDLGTGLYDDERRIRDAKDAGVPLAEPSYLRDEKYLLQWSPSESSEWTEYLVRTIGRFRRGQLEEADSRFLLSREHWL